MSKNKRFKTKARRRKRLRSMESLETRQLLTCVPGGIDIDDQICEATSLTIGSSLTGRITPTEDVDLFAVVVTAGQDVRFETDGQFDSFLRLFDSSGTIDLDTDDDAGPGSGSRIDFTPASSGTVYLGVSRFGNTTYDPVNGGGTTVPVILGDDDSDQYRITATRIVEVTNTLDLVNGNTSSINALLAQPGADGVSLREALEATSATSGHDTIRITAAGSINVGSELIVEDTVDIDSDNATTISAIFANTLSFPPCSNRVMNVVQPVGGAPIDVTLENVTLSGGCLVGNSDEKLVNAANEFSGGGIQFDSFGDLILRNSKVVDNIIGGHFTRGGGIFAKGRVVLEEGSEIARNSTFGIRATGGGIHASSVFVSDSFVRDNKTTGEMSPGGGISAYYTARINNSEVTGNRTLLDFSYGGGIYAGRTLYGESTSVVRSLGNVSILNDSLVSNNYTQGDSAKGGGIAGFSVDVNGSTVSTNKTEGDRADGGGIYAAFNLDFTESTLHGNTTTGGNSQALENLCVFGIHLLSNLASEVAGAIPLVGNVVQYAVDSALDNSVDPQVICDGEDSGARGGGAAAFSMEVTNSEVTGNSTDGDDAHGGALFTHSTLKLTNSLVNGNKTLGDSSRGGALASGIGGGRRNRSGISKAQRDIAAETGATGFNLEIRNSRLANNFTNDVGSKGGAVATANNLYVASSTFESNETRKDDSNGGAVFASDAEIVNSIFQSNKAEGELSAGGAMQVKRNLTIVNSLFLSNETQGRTGGGLNPQRSAGGGAIYFGESRIIDDPDKSDSDLPFKTLGKSATGQLNIDRTTFQANRTDGENSDGGALLLDGKATITNSTFLDNVSERGDGGAIFANGVNEFHKLSINNSTIVNNRAEDGGGGIYLNDLDAANEFELLNSIVLANEATDSNAANEIGGFAFRCEGSSDCADALTSNIIGAPGDTDRLRVKPWAFGGKEPLNGENAIPTANLSDVFENVANGAVSTTIFPVEFNLGCAPEFGQPQLNGCVEHEQTFLELNDSFSNPAIDAGEPFTGTAFDQRGVFRIPTEIDLGAHEIQESLHVTSASNSLIDGTHTTLRGAIQIANANPGFDTITISKSLLGESFIVGGEILVTEGVEIIGPVPNEPDFSLSDDLFLQAPVQPVQDPIVLDAVFSGRIFKFANAGDPNFADDLILKNMQLKRGRVFIDDGGGAILFDSEGDLKLFNSAIESSSTFGVGFAGGAINAANGKVSLYDSRIESSRTDSNTSPGGAIFADSVYLKGSKLYSNHTNGVDSPGGGIYATLGAEIVGSTIKGNYTDDLRSGGGGIAANNGLLRIVNSQVESNETRDDDSPGGALYTKLGSIFLEDNSLLSKNQTLDSDSPGGAVANFGTSGTGGFGSGTVRVTDTTFQENSTKGANSKGGAIYSKAVVSLFRGAELSGNHTANINSGGGAVFASSISAGYRANIVKNRTFESSSPGGALYGVNQVSVTDATLADNSTARVSSKGGAIFSPNDVTVAQSTVSRNSTTSDDAEGGAIYGGDVFLIQSTITGNSTNADVAGLSRGGGIYAKTGIGIYNSIVLGNYEHFRGNPPASLESFNEIRFGFPITYLAPPSGGNPGVIDAASTGIRLYGNSIVGESSDDFPELIGAINSNITGTVINASPNDVFASLENVKIANNLNGIPDTDTQHEGGYLGTNGGNRRTVALQPDINTNPALDGGLDNRAPGGEDSRGQNRFVDLTPNASAALVLSQGCVATCPVGDLNQDGGVGFNDFLRLASNFGNTKADASQGDIDGDGRVGFSDFLLLTSNFGRQVAAASPNGQTTDIGAVELQNLGPETPGLVVTTLEDTTYDRDHLISLREAIDFANSNPGADTITFAPGITGTIELQSQDVELGEDESLDLDILITEQLTIDAASVGGVTVDAGSVSRALTFSDDTDSLTLNSLTLTNGSVVDENGGALLFESAGTLQLLNSQISNSVAQGDRSKGGGIFATGDVVAINSTIHGNVAEGDSAAGGGIFATSASLTNTTIFGNEARGTYSTGGGLHIDNVTLTNATITQNKVAGSESSGGGLYATTEVTFNNTLLLRNQATSDESGALSAFTQRLDEAEIRGDAALVFNGHNVVGESARTFDAIDNAVQNATVDQIFADGTLGDHGGLVPTVALLPSPVNPALDAGLDSLNPQSQDTRGESRKIDLTGIDGLDDGGTEAKIDLGAFEMLATETELRGLIVTTDLDAVDPHDFATSLREAMLFALDASAGTNEDGDADGDGQTRDVIAFATSIDPISIQLTSELPTIESELEIQGPGADSLTIDATGTNQRIFTVDDGSAQQIKVLIQGATLTGGGDDQTLNGGAILNLESLTVSNVTLDSNEAVRGGGIYNDGELDFVRSRASNNTSASEGGGLYLAVGSDTRILESEIFDNTATGSGGGIHVGGTSFLMEKSLVADNTSHDRGGGVHVSTLGSLEISNSTISGNEADSIGGGLGNFLNLSSGKIFHTTIAGNRADADGVGGGVSGGLFDNFGTISLNNSILAGNFRNTADSDIESGLGPASHNLVGTNKTFIPPTLVNGANNIIGNGPASTIDITSIIDVNLEDNGGPTRTHQLATNSDAIDGGTILDGEEIVADQRGQSRNTLVNGPVDIGAVEVQIELPDTLIVTTVQDTVAEDGLLSLREAINLANEVTAGLFGDGDADNDRSESDTITFDPTVFSGSQTITVGSTLTISSSLNIIGPGAGLLTISGGTNAPDDHRVLLIDDGTSELVDVQVSGVTISHGGNGTTNVEGAGIFNSENLTLEAAVLESNDAGTGTGGGVAHTIGHLLVIDTTVSNNAADIFGGGIRVSSGTASVINTTVSGNNAGNLGGGLHAIAPTLIANSTFTGNQDGGGIGGNTGTLTLHNTLVAGNFDNGIAQDIVSATITATHNLIGAATPFMSGIADGVDGNIVGNNGSGVIPIATILDPILANNGGPTPTHMLLADSPALDSGDKLVAEDGDGERLEFDQRGLPRIQDGNSDGSEIVDIGAVEIQAATVAGRFIFYNHSSFDGNSGLHNAADDSAVATNKIPLYSGQTATFDNYTNYSKGINGIIIDIANLPDNDPGPPTLTANDFSFKVGNNSTPSSWATAPAPASITVREGAGVNGSYRVTITWSDGAIQNQWLEVTVKANSKTGLDTPDVHYWGNAVGETGDSTANATTNFTDIQLAFALIFQPATSVEIDLDINRDQTINFTDIQLMFANIFGSIQLIDLSSP